MAGADEIARRAIELATSYLAEREKLAAMADGDLDALRDAAHIVHDMQDGGNKTTALSAQHLAFTLITAAHEELRTR